MNDKNLKNKEENGEHKNNESISSITFDEEGKIKTVNETSAFKGKSCFKKDKDRGQNKLAVKIKEPEPSKTNDEHPKEEIERRKRHPQFKTVKDPIELKQSEFLKDIMNNKNEKKEEPNEWIKFVRKGKRSTTLIEKSQLAQKLLTAEMNIQVNQEKLIVQEKGNPSKK